MTAATTTSAATIRLRPLRRGESGPVDAVFEGMSAHSRHLRFHGPRPRLTDKMRHLLTDVDDHRHVAIVAEVCREGEAVPVGIGRLIATADGAAEIAFSVVDAWHGHGVGRRLLTALRYRAVDLGHARIRAWIMVGNLAAERLLWSAMPEGTARRSGMAYEFTAPLPVRASGGPIVLAV